MECPKCQMYANSEDIVCPHCGALLNMTDARQTGVRGIRQGRPESWRGTPVNRATHTVPVGASRTYVDASAKESASGGTNTNFNLYADPEIYDANGQRMGTDRLYDMQDLSKGPVSGGVVPQGMRTVHRRKHRYKGGVNWVHVAIAAVVLMIVGVCGTYLYLTRTAHGQLIMARMGYDATAEALWQVGEERLDTGDIDGAIEYFLLAREKDGEDNVHVTGLMSLGSAYEAAGRMEDAEALYTEILTDIVPSAPEAYRAKIRMLQAQDRAPEAAELMLLAAEQTGLKTFDQQREDLLPKPPTVNLMGGYYNQKQNLVLTSLEGYDVYYTFDEEAVLPDEGTLYTAPVALDSEGEWPLRAVAVSNKLVSDPLKATYQIYMPTPLQPNVSLAPNTYQQSQRVRLSPGSLTEEELEKNPGYKKSLEDSVAQDLTIYYTIDGSMPDGDSPIWDGTPIKLPARRITIRAVAVNGYNKPSNIKEVTYKIMAEPWPEEPYQMSDAIAGLKLNSTSREAFVREYGEPKRTEDVTYEGVDGTAQRCYYDWGYATMMRLKSGWVLADLYFTGAPFTGPRGTALGNTEAQVTKKFKDMGQVESPSGNRGLYADSEGGMDRGKIYKQEDGTKIIRYQTSTGDGHGWELEYFLNTDGIVTAIYWSYMD